jgi:hypothetical protein
MLFVQTKLNFKVKVLCLFCLLILIVFPFNTFPQEQKKKIFQDIWLIRSESLTDTILKDLIVLNNNDSALIKAKIAEAWWDKDNPKARLFLSQAIDLVERVPNKESDSEKRTRLNITRAIFRIFTTKDTKISQRLLNVLNAEANKSNDSNQETAKTLIDVALSLVKSDPQRAADLGIQALRLGRPYSFSELAMNLRPFSSSLADKLLTEALKIARQSNDNEWLRQLTSTIFPEALNTNFVIQPPPDSFRREFLQLLLNQAQQMELASMTNKDICTFVLWNIAPLKNQYSNLLLDKVGQLQITLSKCPADFSSISQKNDNKTTNDAPLNTIDDLLDAAKRTTDEKTKASLLMRAAQMALRAKQFEKMIAILDSFSEEGRKLISPAWDIARYRAAADLALEKYNQNDLSLMNEIIENVPDYLQPNARTRLVEKLPKTASRQLIIELLTEASRKLPKSSISNSEKYLLFSELTQLYAQIEMYVEAYDSFKQTIVALNQEEKDNPRNENDKLTYALNFKLPKNFPSAFLDNQEQNINESLRSIESPFIRSINRIAFLIYSLNQHKQNLNKEASTVPNEGKNEE